MSLPAEIVEKFKLMADRIQLDIKRKRINVDRERRMNRMDVIV